MYLPRNQQMRNEEIDFSQSPLTAALNSQQMYLRDGQTDQQTTRFLELLRAAKKVGSEVERGEGREL